MNDLCTTLSISVLAYRLRYVTIFALHIFVLLLYLQPVQPGFLFFEHILVLYIAFMLRWDLVEGLKKRLTVNTNVELWVLGTK
jgi:hypothetical protein